MKTVWETIKEIINVKNNNDVSINSLPVGEIIRNAELIANRFITFIQVLLLNRGLKNRFHFVLDRLLIKLR